MLDFELLLREYESGAQRRLVARNDDIRTRCHEQAREDHRGDGEAGDDGTGKDGDGGDEDDAAHDDDGDVDEGELSASALVRRIEIASRYSFWASGVLVQSMASRKLHLALFRCRSAVDRLELLLEAFGAEVARRGSNALESYYRSLSSSSLSDVHVQRAGTAWMLRSRTPPSYAAHRRAISERCVLEASGTVGGGGAPSHALAVRGTDR